MAPIENAKERERERQLKKTRMYGKPLTLKKLRKEQLPMVASPWKHSLGLL